MVPLTNCRIQRTVPLSTGRRQVMKHISFTLHLTSNRITGAFTPNLSLSPQIQGLALPLPPHRKLIYHIRHVKLTILYIHHQFSPPPHYPHNQLDVLDEKE